jgi:hypothetical protein
MSAEEHEMIVEAECSVPHGLDVGRHHPVAPALVIIFQPTSSQSEQLHRIC